jgi:hypothetical protein
VSKLSDQQLEQLLTKSRENIEDHNIAAAQMKNIGQDDVARQHQQLAWGNQALKEEAAKVLSSRVQAQTAEVQKTAAKTSAEPATQLPQEVRRSPEVRSAATELESSEEVIDQVTSQPAITADDFSYTILGLEQVVDRLDNTLNTVSQRIATPQIPKDLLDKLVVPLKNNMGTVRNNGLFEGTLERQQFLYTLKQTFNDLRKTLTGVTKQTAKGEKSAGEANTTKVEHTVQEEDNPSSETV